mmetsp:Transcript_12111/g.17035  ORF Transcript_12111/g.17035 Transcript_12111/m.17035 type:complete len:214 (+) Transcript_12111:191-832(+)
MPKQSRLAFPTPSGWQGWAPLCGVTVLQGSNGSQWTFDRPYFHKNYPIFVNKHFGRSFRVFRDGSSWFWSNGSLPVYTTPHIEGSDPNLPPTGRGWIRCDNQTPTDLAFDVSPELVKRILQQPWSISKHCFFPPAAQEWVVTVVLCNEHIARDSECEVEGYYTNLTSTELLVHTQQLKERLPALPIEMWFEILSFITVGDMMSHEHESDEGKT